MSATKYHCCVDLSAILRGDSFALHALRTYRPELREVSHEAILADAVIRQAKGAEAWPMCDHANKAGYCKGHRGEA